MNASEHTPGKWWGMFDANGDLRATCDSESEANFYVHGRGHMYGGSYRPMPIRSDAAPDLLAALQKSVEWLNYAGATRVDRAFIQECERVIDKAKGE